MAGSVVPYVGIYGVVGVVDFGAVIGNLPWPAKLMLGLVVVLPVLTLLIQSARVKGMIGEGIVNGMLWFGLPKRNYHRLKDVTLTTLDGTTQVDHVVVSANGVFVIETKHMSGWIFGSPHQKLWTQTLYKHSFKFQNPLHQNYAHTKALGHALELSSHVMHSVVVFTGSSRFKTPMPENVVHPSQCIPYMKSKQSEILTPDEVLVIVERIQSQRLVRGRATNTKHIEHVTAKVEAKTAPAPADGSVKRCPRCGSNMVIRKTRKGANAGRTFWGCSTFPRCRQILKIG